VMEHHMRIKQSLVCRYMTMEASSCENHRRAIAAFNFLN
jgi:hypothetical protein